MNALAHEEAHVFGSAIDMSNFHVGAQEATISVFHTSHEVGRNAFPRFAITMLSFVITWVSVGHEKSILADRAVSAILDRLLVCLRPSVVTFIVVTVYTPLFDT